MFGSSRCALLMSSIHHNVQSMVNFELVLNDSIWECNYSVLECNDSVLECNDSTLGCNDSILECDASIFKCNDPILECDDSILECHESILECDAQSKDVMLIEKRQKSQTTYCNSKIHS